MVATSILGSWRSPIDHGFFKRLRFKKHKKICFRTKNLVAEVHHFGCDFERWNQVALESRIRFEKGLHLLLVTWLTVELQVPNDVWNLSFARKSTGMFIIFHIIISLPSIGGKS